MSLTRWLLALALGATFLSCNEKPEITTTSPDALKLYNQGVDHFQKFYYAEAKSAFEKALKADSNFAMASARLAVVHYHSEDESNARAEIARAKTKSPNATRYEQMLIRFFDRMIHYRFAEAGSVADSIISLYPKSAEIYVLRGNMYERTQNFDAGLEAYQKAIEVDSSYALATMSLGYAYSTRGDFDKAIEAMERYIRLVPNEADPRASLADILFRVGRYDDALGQYQKSLEVKPDYWYSMSKIGEVYLVFGRLREAAKQFELGMSKMIPNNQLHASRLSTEAFLQFLRGNYQETVQLCDQSLALDSTHANAAFVCAYALVKLKDFPRAKALVERIREEFARRNLSETMNMLKFHLLQSRLLREQNMTDEALAVCDSAMEYGSEFSRSEVYEELGEIYLKRGDYEKALDALEGALRYNSSAPRALLTLARVYKATGDKTMTNEISKRLLELWKNADSDFQLLHDLKRLRGKEGSSPT